MGKRKTLDKRSTSSKSTKIHIVKLKKDAKIYPYDPSEDLCSERFMSKAFWDCLKDNDPKGAMEMIRIHFESVNYKRASEQEDLSRSTIYEAFRIKNPTIKTLSKLVHFLYKTGNVTK